MTEAVRLGQLLRDGRERRGLTCHQLATETRIPLSHLEALEAGLLHAIPGGLYRRAEARAYAEAVGLDPNLVLTTLKSALDPQRAAAPPDPGTPAEVLSNQAVVVETQREAAAPQVQPAQIPVAGDVAVATGPTHRPWRWAAALVLAGAAVFFGRAGGEQTAISDIALSPELGPLAAAAPDTIVEPEADVVGEPFAEPGEATSEPTIEPAITPTITPAIEPTIAPTVEPPARPRAVSRPEVRRPASPTRGTTRGAERPERAAAAPVLVVNTTPRGARVTVNGIGWGTTPVTIRNLPPGVQRVRVVMDKYVSQERVVHLAAGQSHRVTIPMRASR